MVFLASCPMPAPGQPFHECRDMVGPALLRPFLVVLLASGIATLVAFTVRKRYRQPVSRRRLRVSWIIAVAAITTAAWAGTHDFYHADTGCSAVGTAYGYEQVPQGQSHRDCRAYARRGFALAIAGAATSLALLAFVAKGSPGRLPDPENRVGIVEVRED